MCVASGACYTYQVCSNDDIGLLLDFLWQIKFALVTAEDSGMKAILGPLTKKKKKKKKYNSSGHVRYMAAMAKYCNFLKIFTTSIRRDIFYIVICFCYHLFLWYHIWICYILTTAVAFFCVVADNDFLNNPYNLFYSRILFMWISLYVPLPWPCTLVASVLKHILGGHQKLSNAEKMKNWVLKICGVFDLFLFFFQKPCLSQWRSKEKKIWDKCAVERKIRRKWERQREKKRKNCRKIAKKSMRIPFSGVTPAPWPLMSWRK